MVTNGSKVREHRVKREVDNSVPVILADGTGISIIIPPNVIRGLAGVELDEVTSEYSRIDASLDPLREQKLRDINFVNVRVGEMIWPIDECIWEVVCESSQRRVASTKSIDVVLEGSREDPNTGDLTFSGRVNAPPIFSDDLFDMFDDDAPIPPRKEIPSQMSGKNAFKRHFRGGNEAINVKDFIGAIREFDKALALRPHDARVYVGVARAFLGLKRYNEVFDACARAREYALGNATIITTCERIEREAKVRT